MSSRETIRVSRPHELGRRTVSVLVVDDDPTVLSTVTRTLTARGLTVYLAADGREALEVLAEHGIDAIVADLHMPEMKGTELLAEIRKLYPNVVRILLTADDSGAAAREAINRAEVHRYLTKPWDPHQFVTAILEALAERKTTGDATRSLLGSYESAYPGISTTNLRGSVYVIDPVLVAVGIDRLRETVDD